MSANVAMLLVQDGLVSGLIYALVTLSILLVFLVTRVLWVPAGDFVILGAVTLAMLRQGMVPGTIWIALLVGAAAAVVELARGVAAGQGRRALPVAVGCVLPALLAAPLVAWAAPFKPPILVQGLLVLALIGPMGFPVYRVALRPLADRSVLTLLFAAVAVHLCLTGLGQMAFGSESFRTPPFLPGRLDVQVTRLSYQFLLILAVSLALMTGLWLFTQRSLWGKALRATAVNRFGARLVGVRTETAGALSLVLATSIGALSGILIGPVTALYYDSGFAMGMKGFVGTVIGGMASFPLSLAGALLVGQIETFASFYASSLKEVIVFATLIPFLLWRSAVSRIPEEPEH